MRKLGSGTFGVVYAFKTLAEPCAGKMAYGIPLGVNQFGRPFGPSHEFEHRAEVLGAVLAEKKQKKNQTNDAHMLVEYFDKGVVNVHSVREVTALARLGGHANIVAVKSLMVTHMDNHSIAQAFIVMEECPMALSDVCRSAVCIRMRVWARLFRDVLCGLKHMHDARFIHRDVKPANILVSQTFDGLKIADLGASREFGGAHGPPSERTVVTAPYRAIELILGAKSYGPPIDVWAAGVAFAECLGGERIFGDSTDLRPLLKEILNFLGAPPAPVMRELESFLNPDDGPRLRGMFPPMRAYPVMNLMASTSARHGDEPAEIGPLATMCVSALNLSPTKRPTVDALLALPVFGEDNMAARADVADAMLSAHRKQSLKWGAKA